MRMISCAAELAEILPFTVNLFSAYSISISFSSKPATAS
jgi:hypothetical protein